MLRRKERSKEIVERTLELCRWWPALYEWPRDDVLVLALVTLGRDFQEAHDLMARAQEESDE